MSTDVTIRLTASDEASGAISNLGNSLQTATDKCVDLGNKAKDLAIGISGIATSAFTLYNTYERVETSSVSLDRANLQLERSTNEMDGPDRNDEKKELF